MDVSCILDLG